MTNRKKILVGLLGVVAVASFGLYAFAQTSTQGVTIATTVTETKDLTVIQDDSDYPHAGKPFGVVKRVYSFAADGGAVSTISLERGNSGVTAMKDNWVVYDGFLEVVTPVTPSAGTTNSLGINTAADILGSTATNLSRAAGIYEIIPDGTPGSAVKLTNDLPFNATFSGTTAATAGHFVVYMNVYATQ